jgi:hypothetical protein
MCSKRAQTLNPRIRLVQNACVYSDSHAVACGSATILNLLSTTRRPVFVTKQGIKISGFTRRTITTINSEQ